VTYGHANVDIDALADDATLANACPLADLRLVPDQGAVTDGSLGGDVRGGMDLRWPQRSRVWIGLVDMCRGQNSLQACKPNQRRCPAASRWPPLSVSRGNRPRLEPPRTAHRTVPELTIHVAPM